MDLVTHQSNMTATHLVIIKGLFLLPPTLMLELQTLIPQNDYIYRQSP